MSGCSCEGKEPRRTGSTNSGSLGQKGEIGETILRPCLVGWTRVERKPDSGPVGIPAPVLVGHMILDKLCKLTEPRFLLHIYKKVN